MACTPPKRKASSLDRSPSRPMKACRLFFDPVETVALPPSKFLKAPVSLFTAEPCVGVHEVEEAPVAFEVPVAPESLVAPESPVEPETSGVPEAPVAPEVPVEPESLVEPERPVAPEIDSSNAEATPFAQCFLCLKRLSEVPDDLMGGDMVRLFWKTAFQIFAVGVERLTLPKLIVLKKNLLALPIEVLEEVLELLKWMGEEDVDLAEIPHEYVMLLKIAVASQHRNDAVKARFLRKLRLAFFACAS